MSALSGSFTATGGGEPIHPKKGDFSYRLNCSAYTSGTANYKIGFTESGLPCFTITGTWSATIDLQESDDLGSTWTNMPNESYTANQHKVIG